MATQGRLESRTCFPIPRPGSPLVHAILATFTLLQLLAVGCANRQTTQTDAHTFFVGSPYKYVDAKMIFPERSGDFRRIAIFQDNFPEVGAEYTLPLPSGVMKARAYLYPAMAVPPPGSPLGTLPQGSTPLIQKDFEKHKKALMDSHPGIQTVFESQVSTMFWNSPRNGHMTFLEYHAPSTQQSWRTSLCVYPAFSGRWALRYVFTYPEEHKAANPIAAFQRTEISSFQRGVPLNIPRRITPK